jgi:hypothetical protein
VVTSGFTYTSNENAVDPSAARTADRERPQCPCVRSTLMF